MLQKMKPFTSCRSFGSLSRRYTIVLLPLLFFFFFTNNSLRSGNNESTLGVSAAPLSLRSSSDSASGSKKGVSEAPPSVPPSAPPVPTAAPKLKKGSTEAEPVLETPPKTSTPLLLIPLLKKAAAPSPPGLSVSKPVDAAEARDVAQFNRESNKFINALNELKWTPLNVKRVVAPGKEAEDIAKSTAKMRDSILAVKSKIEDDNADIATEEELQSLDKVARALETFSAYFNKTTSVNFTVGIPDDSDDSISTTPLPPLQQAEEDQNLDLPDLLSSFLKLKTALLSAVTLPFWQAMGLNDITNQELTLNFGFKEAFMLNLFNRDELANLFNTDELMNLFGKDDLMDLFNKEQQLMKSFFNNDDLMKFLNKEELTNLFSRQQFMNLLNKDQDMLNVFGKPELTNMFNKPEMLNFFRPESLNLFNRPELLSLFNRPDMLSFLRPPSFGFFNNKSLDVDFMAGPPQALNTLISGGETLKNFLSMPDLLSLLSLEEYSTGIAESAREVAAITAGTTNKFVYEFNNALQTLKADFQSGAEASLIYGDLQALFRIVQSFNATFGITNAETPPTNSTKFTTPLNLISPALLTLGDGDGFSSPFDSLLAIKAASAEMFGRMFADYLNDIMDVQKNMDFMRNIGDALTLDEKQLPSDVEEQVGNLVSKGNELMEILPFGNMKLFDTSSIRDLMTTPFTAGDESLLKKFAPFTAGDESLLKKFAPFDALKINALQDLKAGFGSSVIPRKLAGIEDLKKLFLLPNVSDTLSNNYIKSPISGFDAFFEKLNPRDLNLDLTPEQLLDTRKLFDSFSMGGKVEFFLAALYSMSSLPMSLAGIRPTGDDVPTSNSVVADNQTIAEKAYLSLANFVKNFNNTRALEDFMQKFSLLSAFSPGSLSFNFSQSFNESFVGSFGNPLDFFGNRDSLMMRPFTLLLLPEIKEQFETTMLALLAPGAEITNDLITQATASTKSLIDVLTGVKSVTPLSPSPTEANPVDAGLDSATGVLMMLSENITAGIQIEPDLVASIQSSMMAVLKSTRPAALLQLPVAQLSAAATSFMDGLTALRQAFTQLLANGASFLANGASFMVNVFETVAKIAMAKGLVFLNAMKVFITAFVFLLIKAPAAVRLFLWDLLMKSMDMPISIGISEEIFANVQFGGAAERLPAFEDASVKSKNLLTDVATKFFTLDNTEGSAPAANPSSRPNLLSDLFKMPLFGFFNRSFNEQLVFNFINGGSALKLDSAEASESTLKSIDETFRAVAKVNELLRGDKGKNADDESVTGSAAGLDVSRSSSALPMLKMFDIPMFDAPLTRSSLLPSLGFHNLPLTGLQQNLPNLQYLPNQLSENVRQSLPALPTLSGVMDSMSELQRQALSNANKGIGEETSFFLGDTMDKLGMRNVFRGFQ